MFSATMNYLLAKWIVVSPAGTTQFNEQLGEMTHLKLPRHCHTFYDNAKCDHVLCSKKCDEINRVKVRSNTKRRKIIF